MGGAISGILGTDSGSNGMQVDQAANSLQPWQQQFNNVYNNQNALAGQLQQQANGAGPNPAALQLQATTQQNAAQAASTIAGQRGMNSGLAARTAGEQQIGADQTAANQAATLKAQQQIAAQQQLASLYGSQQQGVAQQEGAITGANQIGAGLTQGNQQLAAGITGGLLGGVGSALGLAEGGEVKAPVMPIKMADGGALAVAPIQTYNNGPSSNVGQYFNQFKGADKSMQKGISSLAPTPGQGGAASPGTAPTGVGGTYGLGGQSMVDSMGPAAPASGLSMPALGDAAGMGAAPAGASLLPAAALALARGGKVPVQLSPGEIKLSPEQAKKVAEGKANPKDIGKKVPGKAAVKGDSLKNDVVPDKLAQGSVVVKRSAALDPDDRKAIEFVKAVMSKHKLG